MSVRTVLVSVVLFLFTASVAQANLVGKLVGEAGVNPSGASTYSIPINILPGSADMQPSLSINYSSNTGNGVLGLGFSISGLSTIQRCEENIVQDGAFGGVDLDNEDKFCLDGSRLLAVNGGDYGADLTEYRTELESFSKVISYGSSGSGPSNFKVWTKSGLLLEYGVTSDSTVVLNGQILVWGLNKVIDRAENSYSVTYFNDAANNNIRPDRIEYTENSTAGLSADKYVEFLYEDRNDTAGVLVAAKIVQHTKRLNQISIGENGSDKKLYKLLYQDRGTDPSLISQIDECYIDAQAGEQCVAPTVFTWDESQGDLAFSAADTTWGTFEAGKTAGHIIGDFDGDSLGDWMYFQNTGTTGTKNIYVRRSNGTSFGPEEIWSTYYSSCTQVCTQTNPWGGQCIAWATTCSTAGNVQVMDYDGDGKDDLRRDNNVYYSSGTNFGSAQSFNIQGDWWGDINGDGKPDALKVIRNPANHNFPKAENTDIARKINLIESTPTGYAAEKTIDYTFQYCPEGSFWVAGVHWTYCLDLYAAIGDIDADGRDDFITTNEYRYGPDIVANRISKGDDFFAEINTLDTGSPPSPAMIGDINADGREDWVFVDRATGDIKARVATGLGFTPEQIYGSGISTACSTSTTVVVPAYNFTTTSTTCTPFQTLLADVNGDGYNDLVTFGELNATGPIVRTVSQPTPDLLATITDGLGKQVAFTYGTLMDPNVYDEGSFTASFPERVISDNVDTYVVSQISEDNGVGGQVTASYKYESGRIHQHGYGNLGFAKITITDDTTGIKSIEQYRQDYPFIGETVRSETRTSTNELLSEVDVVHGLHGVIGSEPLFPYVQSTTTKIHDLNNQTLISTTVSSSQYDIYGNLDLQTVSITDATGTYTSTTDHVFKAPDTTNWIIDRLESVTASRTGGISNADPRSSSFEYDADGLLTKEKIEPGTSHELVRTYGRDAFGNITSEEVDGPDIVKRTTYSTYDSQGRFPISATNAVGHTETREYNDPWGGATKLRGPNNLDTFWEYDILGRQVKEKLVDGTETNVAYEYCDANCPTQISALVSYKITTTSVKTSNTSQVSPTTIVYYDKLSREILREQQSFSGTSVYVQTEYDSHGRAYRVSNPYFGSTADYWTVYSFDDLGRVIQEDSPATGTTTSDYDGLLFTVTNDDNQTTKELKNSLDWTMSTTDDNLRITYFDYDSIGNLLEVTDSEGNVTSNTYNVRGQKISMDDPDMGLWKYEYNVLGELVAQWDAKTNHSGPATVTMQYDKLGRLTNRVEPEGPTTWTYDAYSSSSRGRGKLASESHYGGFSRSYTYDSKGRPKTTSTVIGGASYDVMTNYDSKGRVRDLTYPGGFAVRHHYNGRGYLYKVRNKLSSSQIYWQAKTVDQFGNITKEDLGYGAAKITTTRAYKQNSGRIQHIDSIVQDLQYTFDSLGNLTQRKDHDQSGLTEDFTYDNLNRLIKADVLTAGHIDLTYDDLGNILTKSDVESGATYNYAAGNAGPHAVTSVGSKTYTYDNNGNQLTGDGKTITWSSYNKPTQIQKGSNTSTFSYGPDRARYQQVTDEGSTTTTTTYIGGIYEKVVKNTTTEKKHFINAGGQTIAIFTDRSAGTDDTHYLHRDHLGSIDTITDQNGAVVEKLSFDAFGKRRLSTWNNGLPTIVSNNTRGFTGHEMLDAVGLIHMNGRVYDPLLGRFLSADPFVQFPKNMQSLNRYSYVLNNPLSYTDPSGFFLAKLYKRVRKIIKGIIRKIREIIGRLYSEETVRVIWAGVKAYYGDYSGIIAFGADGGDGSLYTNSEGGGQSDSNASSYFALVDWFAENYGIPPDGPTIINLPSTQGGISNAASRSDVHANGGGSQQAGSAQGGGNVSINGDSTSSYENLGVANSTFEDRARVYNQMQVILNAKGIDTVWFGVASDLNMQFANSTILKFSDITRPLLDDLGKFLFRVNRRTFDQLISGEISLSGKELDRYLVNKEQRIVQTYLDVLSPEFYRDVRVDINIGLNICFNDTCNEVRKRLASRFYSYGNLNSRITYGYVLIDQARAQ